jgi:hypothetical protein
MCTHMFTSPFHRVVLHRGVGGGYAAPCVWRLLSVFTAHSSRIYQMDAATVSSFRLRFGVGTRGSCADNVCTSTWTVVQQLGDGRRLVDARVSVRACRVLLLSARIHACAFVYLYVNILCNVSACMCVLMCVCACAIRVCMRVCMRVCVRVPLRTSVARLILVGKAGSPGRVSVSSLWCCLYGMLFCA